MFSEVQALPINVPLLYVILGSLIHMRIKERIFFSCFFFYHRLYLVDKMSAR